MGSIRKYLVIRVILLVLGALAIFGVPRTALSAQTAPGWSETINLSNSETQSNTPSIAADPYGNVHVVWSEVLEDGRSFIVYTMFDGANWTQPQEVLTSPYNQTALNPVIVADISGNRPLRGR